METFLAAFVVFAVAVVAMAVGVILSNRRLRGTCGGLGNLRDKQGRTLCDACTNPAEDCRVDGLPSDESAPADSEDQETVRSTN